MRPVSGRMQHVCCEHDAQRRTLSLCHSTSNQNRFHMHVSDCWKSNCRVLNTFKNLTYATKNSDKESSWSLAIVHQFRLKVEEVNPTAADSCDTGTARRRRYPGNLKVECGKRLVCSHDRKQIAGNTAEDNPKAARPDVSKESVWTTLWEAEGECSAGNGNQESAGTGQKCTKQLVLRGIRWYVKERVYKMSLAQHPKKKEEMITEKLARFFSRCRGMRRRRRRVRQRRTYAELRELLQKQQMSEAHKLTDRLTSDVQDYKKTLEQNESRRRSHNVKSCSSMMWTKKGWARTCQRQLKMHENKREVNTKVRPRQQERNKKKWHEEIPYLRGACGQNAGGCFDGHSDTTHAKMTKSSAKLFLSARGMSFFTIRTKISRFGRYMDGPTR